MLDCFTVVPFCLVNERPTLFAEDRLVAWISLRQETLKSFCVKSCLANIFSLVKPIKKFVVKMLNFVPDTGEFSPVGGYLTFHRQASAFLVSYPAAISALPEARNPTP